MCNRARKYVSIHCLVVSVLAIIRVSALVSFWIYSDPKRRAPLSVSTQTELACWAPGHLSMTIQGLRDRVNIVRGTKSFLALLLVVESIQSFGRGVFYVWTTRVRTLVVCTSGSALRPECSSRLRSRNRIILDAVFVCWYRVFSTLDYLDHGGLFHSFLFPKLTLFTCYGDLYPSASISSQSSSTSSFTSFFNSISSISILCWLTSTSGPKSSWLAVAGDLVSC